MSNYPSPSTYWVQFFLNDDPNPTGEINDSSIDYEVRRVFNACAGIRVTSYYSRPVSQSEMDGAILNNLPDDCFGWRFFTLRRGSKFVECDSCPDPRDIVASSGMFYLGRKIPIASVPTAPEVAVIPYESSEGLPDGFKPTHVAETRGLTYFELTPSDNVIDLSRLVLSAA